MESRPLSAIMVRHRVGKTLVYNHTACLQETWCLTCCSSHPTQFKRNQHLCYPEGITQSQETGTLKVPILCKVDSREGKTNSFIVMFFGFQFCFFNKQTAWEEKYCGKEA